LKTHYERKRPNFYYVNDELAVSKTLIVIIIDGPTKCIVHD